MVLAVVGEQKELTFLVWYGLSHTGVNCIFVVLMCSLIVGTGTNYEIITIEYVKYPPLLN